MEPLVEALRRHVMKAEKLHADDVPVPVLAPGLGKTKTGRLWTYVRDDRPAGDATPPAVWFAYSPDRKGEHPKEHLSQFRGTLQADGYAGFDQIYEAGSIREAACWAHVRRKFYDIQVAHKSAVAAEALERIAALYVIEKEIRRRSPEERRAVRNERSRPLLESLKTMAGRDPGSALEKIRYLHGGPLRSWTMGSAPALLRRWSIGDRQQCGGTIVACGGSWTKELSVRGIGPRWRECCGALQFDRHGKIKWHRS